MMHPTIPRPGAPPRPSGSLPGAPPIGPPAHLGPPGPPSQGNLNKPIVPGPPLNGNFAQSSPSMVPSTVPPGRPIGPPRPSGPPQGPPVNGQLGRPGPPMPNAMLPGQRPAPPNPQFPPGPRPQPTGTPGGFPAPPVNNSHGPPGPPMPPGNMAPQPRPPMTPAAPPAQRLPGAPPSGPPPMNMSTSMAPPPSSSALAPAMSRPPGGPPPSGPPISRPPVSGYAPPSLPPMAPQTSIAPGPPPMMGTPSNQGMLPPPQMQAGTNQQGRPPMPPTNGQMGNNPMLSNGPGAPPGPHAYPTPPQPQQQHQTQPYGAPPGKHAPYQNGGIGGMFDQRSFMGVEPVDLLQNRHILPPKALPLIKPKLQVDSWTKVNCSSDIFRCTLTKIPETEGILKKSRLPLGVLIHPFKDLSHLPVIQCGTIVRCRQCRTYINPFVHFVDQRRWRCNVCYRVNDLPEEFLYDPVSKTYGDPSRRPECKAATIEFIAPSEYMLRPPQPAVYIFLLDVSHQAIENGYLKMFCECLLDELDKLPGDGRTQVAFITYDRTVHFYSMPEGSSQPTQLTVSDIDDMFLPSPSDLLVNLNDCRNLVIELLTGLPDLFTASGETHSALGAALQAAFKMAAPTGGRITVFQSSLPNVGPGKLSVREVMRSSSSSKDSALLGPATDFYKKLALDCSGQQVAVDLFTLSSQYVDLATLSGISKFSGGQIQHFPGYHIELNTAEAAKFDSALRRYLTRKIGFEAVMRIRCTRGLTPHTFHGNFFVRSTDLLSLPNINPDAGFAMQVAIEDDLRDSREVCFQAALLYTSSKGERRIRVHTLCIPTTNSVSEVINGADQQAIIGMLAKFGAERAMNDSVADAKEGLVVSAVDTLETYKAYSSIGHPAGLLISSSLKLLPLYTLALMRARGFKKDQKLDERSFCFSQFKCLPLGTLMQYIYPDMYRVDELSDTDGLEEKCDDSESEDEGESAKVVIPQPARLQLSYERISATGMYLIDRGDIFILYLCRGLHQFVLERVFGVTSLHQVNESWTELPERGNPESERLRTFVQWLNGFKAYPAPIKIVREDGKQRHLVAECMVEDRMEGSFSYFEFLQNLKQQIK